MKQNLGVVPREYPLSYVVIPMPVLVKYGQTMEWKARTHPRPRSEHIMLICPAPSPIQLFPIRSRIQPQNLPARAAHPAAAES